MCLEFEEIGLDCSAGAAAAARKSSRTGSNEAGRQFYNRRSVLKQTGQTEKGVLP